MMEILLILQGLYIICNEFRLASLEKDLHNMNLVINSIYKIYCKEEKEMDKNED